MKQPIPDPNDPLLRTAAFGRQCEHFLKSDIGDYLLKQALAQKESAMAALVDVDPTETSKIIALQMKAQIADRFIDWLGEAVATGMQALQALESGFRGDDSEH